MGRGRMTDERWLQLMNSDTEPLTEQEVKEGWHFCPEWDGLLMHRVITPEDCSCFELS
jgi:hypothetical protein